MMTVKSIFVIAAACFILTSTHAGTRIVESRPIDHNPEDSGYSNTVLEPWTYTENFEEKDLGAWAAYPLWQDNAYDPNFRVGKIVPGDSNISIVQKVTPYSHVDNYAGAQKLLDMYLVPGAEIRFRYYLKTNEKASFLKVRLAAGSYGKIDVTIPEPERNKWTWVTVNFNDFVKENPAISGHNKVRVYALAFLAEIPDADPAMPFYLGLDDITFKGARATAFRFIEPAMYKLPEFKPYIPKEHYDSGDIFKLSGSWPVGAKKVKLEIVSFTDKRQSFFKGELSKKNDRWVLRSLKLDFPEGLYLGKLTAYDHSRQLSETEFTIHIAPKNIAGKHPRLLFDEEKRKWINERFREKRFSGVYNDILKNAKDERREVPLDSLIFDLDQFPDENWLPSWNAFGSHIYNTGDALKWNALAYTLHGDTVAGNYAKNILIRLAGWPIWVSPWMIKRGRFSEHRMGTWSHDIALAYDLTYNLMTPDERAKIRKAIMKKIIEGVYRTYVYDNNVTSNTSNWIAHTVGGALMNIAAIFEDGPETENLEPYFTGCMMKFYAFINHVTDSKDGSWGEGLGYNDYSFSNMSYSVPSLKNVYHIDVTAPLRGTYNEYIWGGIIRNRKWFGFGDSNDSIGSATNWKFLLAMQKEPRLSWYYNYLKGKETFKDVLFNTSSIPQENPFEESPVKAFRKIGTTVFKSGWDKNDFVFVMRTGPFFNHQHLDQGSFYLADRGITFIEDQPIHHSDYYADPLYQSDFTQPVAHSTILIDGNHQSQRVGDPVNFAPGFNDYAFIADFLDGADAAFSRGDIGRLYWGKVKSLSRNILYIKPHTLLMLDVAIPAQKDVDVTLLYHTAHLKDIHAGEHISTITKNGFTLNLMHLSPEFITSKAVETPHYLNTLLKEKPLIKEGMLTITARTSGAPLVMANLLTTTPAGAAPDVTSEKGDGFVSGTASGKKFVFTTKPGNLYRVGDRETDALAMTWSPERTFVARATVFREKGALIIESDTPATFELSADSLRYSRNEPGKFIIGVKNRPSSVMLNGKRVNDFIYSNEHRTIALQVPEGDGTIRIK
jgi:hypothetical protein